MGRYNFAAQRVHANATLMLQAASQAGRGSNKTPPPWYNVIGTYPPSERLVRPPMQRPQKPGKKASKLFHPVPITYEEDRLRWEYFNDHPWELAQPRVVVENDGRDGQKWDWSVSLDHSLNRPAMGTKDKLGRNVYEEWEKRQRSQVKRPINGEAVIKRQAYLMRTGLTEPAAYDKARKEFYRVRHYREIELRTAREEALATGAYFTLGPLEKGNLLEDQHYENWRKWAANEIMRAKALQSSAQSVEVEGEGADGVLEEAEEPSLDESLESAIPGSKRGLEAKGGIPVHP